MSIRQLFNRAVLSGFAIMTLSSSAFGQAVRQNSEMCDKNTQSSARAQALTEGEKILVQSIFAGTINTDQVKKYMLAKPSNGHGVAATCDGAAVEFYDDMHASDYSDPNLAVWGTFLHELAHIWQFQNGVIGHDHAQQIDNVFKRIFSRGDKYSYRLDEKKDFTKYGTEQQAALIEDYGYFFLHPAHISTYRLSTYRLQGHDTPEKTRIMLAKVVEDQFPQARITRLALEAKNNAQTVKPVVTGLSLK